MTIGNLPNHVRASPKRHAIVLIALLPVPPRAGENNTDDIRRAIKANALHEALANILRPLTTACDTGLQLRCPDGNLRQCYPVVSSWLTDHMEYYELLHTSSRNWPVCEVPTSKLGSSPLDTYARRDSVRYAQLVATAIHQFTPRTERKVAIAELKNASVKVLDNALWKLPHVSAHDLHVPDLLHSIYLGMLKHLMDWTADFLQKYGRSQIFDKIWLSVERYLGLLHFSKTFQEVGQWQGRELRAFGRLLLPCFVAALDNPNPTEEAPFLHAVRCVKAFIDFHLLAQYHVHTGADDFNAPGATCRLPPGKTGIP